MLRLVIMRHAKSDWSGAHGDHARPLNPRGQRAAPAVGAALVKAGYTPEVVICSDSQRTTETWLLMAAHFEGLEPTFSPALYLASPSVMLGVVARLAPDCERAMLLAHNPGSSVTATWLCGVNVELKTAFAAILETDAESWAEATASPGRWTLREIVAPPK